MSRFNITKMLSPSVIMKEGRNFMKSALRYVFAFAVLSETARADIYFVRSSAVGANDGTSWLNAFTDLQDALASAIAGDEIWVAAGTYTPDRGSGDPALSFVLVSGVALYGGFGGFEKQREHRDWLAHPTILSGDLNSDDGPVQDCAEYSNCCEAHDDTGCDDFSCQQIVCAGSPGCCNDSWDDGCAESAHYACRLGNWNRCDNTFEIVQAWGCDSSTVLDGFTITKSYFNYHIYTEYAGLFFGAGFRSEGSNVRVANCMFINNADYGILSIGGDLNFDSCILDDNKANVENGRFANCHFVNGGGSAFVYGQALFEGCTFKGSNYYGLHTWHGSYTTVNNSVFSKCQEFALFTRGFVSLENTTIENNPDQGIHVIDGRLEARKCIIRGNGHGAVRSYGSVLLKDTLIADHNSAFYNYFLFGGQQGQIEIVNCTMARNLYLYRYNEELDFAAGIRVYNSGAVIPVSIRNSILWAGAEYEVTIPLLRESPVGPSYTVSNSIIQGWTGEMGGVGNSSVDPMFIDPDGPDDIPGNEDDDFRLSLGSPARNAGDPSYLPAVGEADLDGHARVLCGTVDIGAYEFGVGDFDCDGAITLLDQPGFAQCLAGPQTLSAAGCEALDFAADADVDLSDFAQFQNLFDSMPAP